MISSLINADLEQRKIEIQRERRAMQTVKFMALNLIIPLTVPAAFGFVFPPVAVVWLVSATAITMSVGRPGLVPVLALLYLLASLLVWISMRWVGRRRGYMIRRKVKAE